MPAKLDIACLPDWPRLMDRETAAAYVSLSVGSLKLLGVRPIRVGGRVLYDRSALDRVVDALAANDQSGSLTNAKAWLERLDDEDGP